jgi:hypothetical protein
VNQVVQRRGGREMDLSTELWEGVTPAEREAIARRLAKQLPSGFTFQAIRPFRLGERRQQHVAFYQKDKVTTVFRQ